MPLLLLPLLLLLGMHENGRQLILNGLRGE